MAFQLGGRLDEIGLFIFLGKRWHARLIDFLILFRYDLIWIYDIHFIKIIFYHLVKILIKFWYKCDLNPNTLFDNKIFYQLS